MAVTEADVRAIIKVSANETITSFLADALLIVTEELSSSGLSVSRLDLITKYLAAHFIALKTERGGLVRAKVGESEERYQVERGTYSGLDSTRFGRTAIALDTSGTLGTLAANPVRAEFRVV